MSLHGYWRRLGIHVAGHHSARVSVGDLYEYMLGKIASAGQNGQFRTPRHIIALMVELVQPVPTDAMCDPVGGTCGFPSRWANICGSGSGKF